ncbi:uroporphyrinogen-III synthase [Aliikangiella marina]|uniref:uroporphyrinogen-III synthase n=1 Tax=Aliikangiella marina TaxID=1712262 RepID=UPI00163D6B89|nr:uroporphyrinogen-III synthase [Aliikangiella marina]
MTTDAAIEFDSIVVTRPLGQSPELAAKLQHALASLDKPPQIEHFPLIRIEPLQNVPSESIVPDMVIFISSNAVKHFAHLEHLKFTVADSQLFAVGENTAKSVKDYLSRDAFYPQKMNAEGLLALPELTNVMGQQWLIIKGEGGRALLREVLLTRGAKVTEIDVYKRCLPSLEAQKGIQEKAKRRPLWLISSAEALNNLHRILGLSDNAEHHTKIIITSERLAELALQKGFIIVSQSAGAAEEQLVQCVKNLFYNQE